MKSRRQGFTLLEIMIVVAIMGVLALIALPSIGRAREGSLVSRITNDYRTHSDAFNQYILENGSWPAAAAVSVIPTGMTDYLDDQYANATPLGGGFSWSGNTAILAIEGAVGAAVVMAQVDANLDDGNLATGNFTQSGNNYRLTLQ